MRSLVLALVACSAPPAPSVITPPPPVSEPPPVVVAEPVKEKDPFEGIDPQCRGASFAFDTEESENACLIPNTSDHRLPLPSKDLEITAAVLEPSVKPGAKATVVVTVTNKATTPTLVFFDVSCDDEVAFPISAIDSTKKRVDFIGHKNCDNNSFGCTRRVLRVVLDPGGSLKKTRSFVTVVTKVQPDCADVVAGPIKPGTYKLRVANGFNRDEEGIYRSTSDTTLVIK